MNSLKSNISIYKPDFDASLFEMSYATSEVLKDKITFGKERDVPKEKQANNHTKERDCFINGVKLVYCYQEDHYKNNPFFSGKKLGGGGLTNLEDDVLKELFGFISKDFEYNHLLQESTLEKYTFTASDIFYALEKNKREKDLTKYLKIKSKKYEDNLLSRHLKALAEHKKMKFCNGNEGMFTNFLQSYEKQVPTKYSDYRVYKLDAEWLELKFTDIEPNFVFKESEEPLLIKFEMNYFIITNEKVLFQVPYYSMFFKDLIVDDLLEKSTPIELHTDK